MSSLRTTTAVRRPVRLAASPSLRTRSEKPCRRPETLSRRSRVEATRVGSENWRDQGVCKAYALMHYARLGRLCRIRRWDAGYSSVVTVTPRLESRRYQRIGTSHQCIGTSEHQQSSKISESARRSAYWRRS